MELAFSSNLERFLVWGEGGAGSIEGVLGACEGPINKPTFLDFSDFSDFLGRLQPSTTSIQKTPGTLRVESSS